MTSYNTPISPSDLEKAIWRYSNPKYPDQPISPDDLEEVIISNPESSYTKTDHGRNGLVFSYFSCFLG